MAELADSVLYTKYGRISYFCILCFSVHEILISPVLAHRAIVGLRLSISLFLHPPLEPSMSLRVPSRPFRWPPGTLKAPQLTLQTPQMALKTPQLSLQTSQTTLREPKQPPAPKLMVKWRNREM